MFSRCGLRSSADAEEEGLDLTEHGELGYHGEGSGYGERVSALAEADTPGLSPGRAPAPADWS
jgi:hypothetical protein